VTMFIGEWYVLTYVMSIAKSWVGISNTGT
jgi:hypothetical protein